MIPLIPSGLATLEENIPLSQSLLWTWQREFFAQKGVAAWTDSIPFYVTSNPVIADSYAQIIVRYLQDLARQPDFDAQKPIYIVELGAGSGKFSYYCVRRLVALCRSLRLPFSPCYVMTDFAPSNIEFWRSQQLFQPFIDAGFLDMALFDVDSPAPLSLLHRQQTLNLDGGAGAIICLANYVFDSTRHDVFYIKDKVLHEGLIHLQASPQVAEAARQGSPSFADVRYRYTPRRIQPASYYADPLWNGILKSYCEEQSLDGHFVFPTAMIRALEFLEQLGSGRLLLLSSDKGYTTPQQIAGRAPPKLEAHGSFSIAVNFDAVRRYIQAKRGVSFHPPPGAGLRTCVYALGLSDAALVETATAVACFVQECCPYDFYRLDKHLRQDASIGLPVLIAHLRRAHWDPVLVSSYRQQLLDGIRNEQVNVWKDALREGLTLAEQMIYPLPGLPDHEAHLTILQMALSDGKILRRAAQPSVTRPPAGAVDPAQLAAAMAALRKAGAVRRRS